MTVASVRLFRAPDETDVALLWDRVFPDGRRWNGSQAIVRRKVAQGDGLFWVGEADGRIAGAVMAGWDGQRGWIYHLAVAPEVRRCGLGRALVRAAEAGLVARGCPKINLQVLPSNREVVTFYERLGWSVEERVSMGKNLLPPDRERPEHPDLGGADDVRCSFCGKSQHEARKIVAGPRAFICDECVGCCNDIIAEECGDGAPRA